MILRRIPAASCAEYPARGPKTVDTEQHGHQRYPAFRRTPARLLRAEPRASTDGA
jgi:hypothetical protein